MLSLKNQFPATALLVLWGLVDDVAGVSILQRMGDLKNIKHQVRISSKTSVRKALLAQKQDQDETEGEATDDETDEDSAVTSNGEAHTEEEIQAAQHSGKNSCQILPNKSVNTDDADNFRNLLFIRTASDCQSRCGADYLCEAFTWWPKKITYRERRSEGAGGTYVPMYTCALYKKKAEDAQWHRPVQFKAEQHTQAGYPQRHCESCGQKQSHKKYLGKNLQVLTGISTWEKCQDKCERDSRCKTFSFNHAQWSGKFGKCLLKRELQHNGVWDAAMTSGIPCEFSSGPQNPSWPR